jgi:hypothetical protein
MNNNKEVVENPVLLTELLRLIEKCGDGSEIA